MRLRPGLLSPVIVFLVAAGSLWGEPAAADWLVTTDGSTVETREAWQVKGRLVVFRTSDGTLASMRLKDVDLEASEARTEAAKRAARERPERRPSQPASPAKARFVLTDADVGHVEEPPLRDPADDQIEGQAGATPESATNPDNEDRAVPPEDNPLEVTSWEAVLGAGSDGVLINGIVKNPSELFASGISIRVTLLNLEGAEIESRTAATGTKALAPGEQGSFQTSFPGVFSVANALFEVTSFNAVVSE